MSTATPTAAATQVVSAAVVHAFCNACRHTATRSRDPWDNQYRCAEGCRCTMQGCCPGETTQEA